MTISPTVTANLIRIVTDLERQRAEAIEHERSPAGKRQMARLLRDFGSFAPRAFTIDESDIAYLRAALTALTKNT
jgi:hypothetical protein